MKSTTLLFSIIIILACFKCTNDQRFVSADQSIYSKVGVEKNDSTFFIENIADHYSDNIIYSNCNEIVYEYNYRKEEKELFLKLLRFGEWEFVPSDSIENGIGSGLIMEKLLEMLGLLAGKGLLR